MAPADGTGNNAPMRQFLARLRRPRVAAALCIVVLALVARGPAAQRLTGLFFAPKPGPATPPAEAGMPVEQVTFPAKDGTPIEGWWFRSAAPGGARAVVVFAHGNGWNLEKQWRFAARLAPRGFDVLAFDYRGFGDTPGKPSRAAAREDLLSALDEAKRRAQAAGIPVVAAGQSMGAALVVETLAGRDDVAAIVADSPFSSWSEIASWHLVQRSWARAAVRAGLSTLLSATGTDPVDAAPRITVPLLVIGGENDEVTPPHMASAIATAAGARLMMLPGAGHPGRRADETEAAVTQAEAEFFDQAIARSR